MSEQDPEEFAQQLERETERLDRHSDELQQEVEDARDDWQRKRRDESVPGAPPPEVSEEPREG